MLMTRTSVTNRILGFSSALALLVMLASCVPESVNPLGSPAPSAADSRLEGNWLEIKNPQNSLVFTGTEAPWLQVLCADISKEAKEDEEYNVYPTTIDKAHFLNVRGFEKDDSGNRKESAEFLFLRYEIDADGNLSIWSMDEDIVVKAIKAQKLKGSVQSKDGDKTVILKDSTANLVKFIEKTGAEKLFHREFGTYRKAPPLKPIRIQVAPSEITLDGGSVTVDGIGTALAKRKAESGADDPVVIRFSVETTASFLLQIREIALKTHPSVHLVFEQPGNPPTLKELSISDATARFLK